MSAAQLGLFAPAAPPERVVGEAVISPDGRYRYLLTRWWSRGPRVLWIMLRRDRRRVACLGVTKSGAPRHPLYVPGAAPLMQWPGGVEPWPPADWYPR